MDIDKFLLFYTSIVTRCVSVFVLSDQRTFLEKYDLCPHVQLQTVVFYGGFGAVASSLLSGLSGYVDIGLVLLWIYSGENEYLIQCK